MFSQGRLEVVDEIVAPDYKEHGTLPPGMPAGREGLKAVASELRKGFPDLSYRIDLMVAEGDFVAEWAETHIVKIANGKVSEHWGVVDQIGMLRQLGLAPAPEAARAAR